MSRAKTLTPAVAVHRHERNMHAGKPLIPMKRGGKVEDSMKKAKMATKPMSPKRPVAPSGAPLNMAKGGRACMAAGGAAKVRKDVATPAGKPKGATNRTKMTNLI